MNPTEIADALEAIATAQFDAKEFPFAFAEATGNAKATISKLRTGSYNKSKLPGGVLMNRKFYSLTTTTRDLEAGLAQLRADKKVDKHKPAILVVTDGLDVSAEHPATGDTLHCKFTELHHHFGFFLPAAGMSRYQAAEENEVDVRATGILAKLYDALLQENPEWQRDVRRHDLNQFITRLVFCMFAEDVGILSNNQFSELVFNHAGDKGVEAHLVIVHAFQAMQLPEGKRAALPAWACDLPYVNGGLFDGRIDSPTFNRTAFRYFQDATRLDWKQINPDILGSMIQTIAVPEKRAELGMHYTSVPNILKLLEPLVLDDLDKQIEKAWDSISGLKRIIARIGRIRIFDPACGSGNFLVVAYRELRSREMRILQQLGELSGDTQLQLWSSIELASFFGIDIADFAVETAKLSLFIAEYQANSRFAEMFGACEPALPLRSGGNIVCGNALRLNWENVCRPPGKGEEVFVVGNPPFLGKAQQTVEHKSDKDFLFSDLGVNYKAFDYVVGWYYKASRYIEGHTALAALVATNSIVQGDAASSVWPLVLNNNLEIAFAHRTIKWRNNATANAAVTCVVVGIRNRANEPKVIFDGNYRSKASNINSYLLDMKEIVVKRSNSSL